MKIGAIKNVLRFIKLVTSGSISAQRMGYLNDYAYERELVTPTDFKSQLNAYKSWIYVCANKNAISLSSFPLRLYVAKTTKNKLLVRTKKLNRKTREFLHSEKMGHLASYINKSVEIEEVIEHPFLTLMKNVNPFSNSSS